MSTVSVTVDYSNGAQKTFAAVPWTAGQLIIEAVEAAGAIAPGLDVHFGSSRNGSVLNLRIDGLPAERSDASWALWVNARPAPERLATKTTIGFDPDAREPNEVQAGDHVLCKLVAATVDES